MSTDFQDLNASPSSEPPISFPACRLEGLGIHANADGGDGKQVLTGAMPHCDNVYAERLLGQLASCFSQGPAILRSLLLACEPSSTAAAAGSGSGASTVALPAARVREIILSTILSLDPAIIDVGLVRDVSRAYNSV